MRISAVRVIVELIRRLDGIVDGWARWANCRTMTFSGHRSISHPTIWCICLDHQQWPPICSMYLYMAAIHRVSICICGGVLVFAVAVEVVHRTSCNSFMQCYSSIAPSYIVYMLQRGRKNAHAALSPGRTGCHWKPSQWEMSFLKSHKERVLVCHETICIYVVHRTYTYKA